jgi:hypothetical protein
MTESILNNSPFSLFNKSLDESCTLKKQVKHIPLVEDQEDRVSIYNERIKILIDERKYSWCHIKRKERHELLKLYFNKIDRVEAEEIFYTTGGDLLLLDFALKTMDERLHPGKVGAWVYDRIFDPDIIKTINTDLSHELANRYTHLSSDEDQLRADDDKDRMSAINNWS